MDSLGHDKKVLSRQFGQRFSLLTFFLPHQALFVLFDHNFQYYTTLHSSYLSDWFCVTS